MGRWVCLGWGPSSYLKVHPGLQIKHSLGARWGGLLFGKWPFASEEGLLGTFDSERIFESSGWRFIRARPSCLIALSKWVGVGFGEGDSGCMGACAHVCVCACGCVHDECDICTQPFLRNQGG